MQDLDELKHVFKFVLNLKSKNISKQLLLRKQF